MRKNISVIAKMDESGLITPLTILWSPSEKFDIEKVVDIRSKASTKGGGIGLRYTCKIKGQEKYLWLDEYTWFVEVENLKL